METHLCGIWSGYPASELAHLGVQCTEHQILNSGAPVYVLNHGGAHGMYE
jgi:hypothetical protein